MIKTTPSSAEFTRSTPIRLLLKERKNSAERQTLIKKIVVLLQPDKIN